MRGHSTVHQLIEIYHNICLSLENREVMCTVFCDISKAFDKVWHRGLLKKLKAYGISGNLLHWFENYLSDRNQKVVLQNCLSEVGNIKGGVPQGSVICYSYYISMILPKIFKVFHDCLLMIHHYRIHLLI
jgi:hypothetical protein